MDKHTPGPWRVSDENPKIVIEDRLPFYSESRIVAKVSGYPDSGFFFSDEEAADHARLIAAAPKLNDLVKEARAAMTAYLEDHQHNAPHDCYATGPKTGDEFHDLVRCPGCCAEKAFTSLVAKIDAALAKARGDDNQVECQACYGKGFNDVERQVAERKSDVQTFRETCDACEGTGKVSAGGAA